MTTHDRHCLEAGLLVGPTEWLPVLPADHRWTERHPRPGCNQLRCSRCGAQVTSTSSPEGRHYRCQCTDHVERGLRVLESREGPDHPDRALPWRCAGHPMLVLPAELDGTRIDESSLEELAGACFDGRPPAHPWPSSILDRAGSAAWVARLYALLSDSSARDRIAAAAVAALSSTEPLARASAIDFYLYHPLARGADELAPRLHARPADFVGVSLPWSRKYDLAHLVWQVLVERLHLRDTKNGGPIDPAALALAREHVLAPGAQMSVLLRLGHWERDWVIANAAAIVAATPAVLPTLFDVLAKADPAKTGAATAAIDALLAHPDLDRAEVSRLGRQRLPRGALRAHLDALGT